MIRTIQWILFLMIAIGAPLGGWAIGERQEARLLLFMCGLSLSLFVFMFVPYFARYSMSEMMIMVMAIAIVMAVNAQVLRPRQIQAWTMWVAIVVTMLAPVILFWLISRKRPVAERAFQIVAPKKTLAQRRRGAWFALLHSVVGLVIGIAALAVNLMRNRYGFNGFYLVGMLGFVGLVTNCVALMHLYSSEPRT